MSSLRAQAIIDLQDGCCERWHRAPIEELQAGDFLSAIALEHEANFRIWHVEDEARRRDVPDSVIAAHKRTIDQLNQRRNDRMERIDEEVARLFPWAVDALDLPANTESPGAACDRLSVMSLRLYHMREQLVRVDVDDAHRAQCAAKVDLILRQRAALANALDLLFLDLEQRRKRLIVFRQLKMYNDPSLNAALSSKR